MFDIKDGEDLDNRLAIIEKQIREFSYQRSRGCEILDAIAILRKEDLTKSWGFLTSREKSDMLNRYQAILQLALTLKFEWGENYPMLQKQILQMNSRLLTDFLIAGGDVNAFEWPSIVWNDEKKKITLLGMASNIGNFEAVEVLIKYHADVNIRSYYTRDHLGLNNYRERLYSFGPCIAREMAFKAQSECFKDSEDFDAFEKVINLLDRESRSRLQMEFGEGYLKHLEASGVDSSAYYVHLSSLKEDAEVAREYCLFSKNDSTVMQKLREEASNLISLGTYDLAKQNLIRTEIEKTIECNKQSIMRDGTNPEKWSVLFLKKLLKLHASPIVQNNEGKTVLHKMLEKITDSPFEARIVMAKIRLFLDCYEYYLPDPDKFLTITDSKENSPISLIRQSGNATLIQAFERELLARNIKIDSVQTTPVVRFSLPSPAAPAPVMEAEANAVNQQEEQGQPSFCSYL